MSIAADPAEQTGEGGLVGSTISAITRHIRTNALGPGDQLPSEAALSKDLKVSRTVVREAFRSLAAMRLIDLRTGRRATVAELDPGGMSLFIEHGVVTEQITVQQIYDVRRTIETRTATLAALRRTDGEAAAIVKLAVAMREDILIPEKVMEYDLAFHAAIAAASRNPLFALIIGAIEGVTRQTWPIGWRSRNSEKEQLEMIDLHIAIARAIEAGQPQAARDQMARHFDVSVRALIEAGIA